MNLSEALAGVPGDIARSLENELSGLMQRYRRGDWSPSELNGGRLAEAVLRYLEWKDGGSFTPLGKQLNRARIVGAVKNNVALEESVRVHMPRAAELIMDIRNGRDVAHLSDHVSVNQMDSQLVLRLGAWLVAEIVRLESSLAPSECQELVDSLTVKQVPIVEVFDGDAVVVAPQLRASERVLVALYHSHPASMNLEDLRTCVKYGNASRFRTLVSQVDRQGLAHVKGSTVFLTHLGVERAEALLS
jgi:hypothetical protein